MPETDANTIIEWVQNNKETLNRTAENIFVEEIFAKRDVTSSILPREEAMRIPDLIRTKINLLPQGITEVRVVNIQGLDLQADGGTHVENTAEVKRIYVTGHESKGKINKRIRIRIAD